MDAWELLHGHSVWSGASWQQHGRCSRRAAAVLLLDVCVLGIRQRPPSLSLPRLPQSLTQKRLHAHGHHERTRDESPITLPS